MVVFVSEILGDIVIVCDLVGGGSDFRFWMVNGDFVGYVYCREIICFVVFFNQFEGIFINVIVGGLENGIVRLWSIWDLKFVREIIFFKLNKFIISFIFFCDGYYLYIVNSDGIVIVWCWKDQQCLKQLMFYFFFSSYVVG